MTTETDKLVEMARATGAFHAIKGCDWLTFELPQLAAFRDRIIASLCGDVEPVAWLDTAIDWTATGQPITRRICIQAQCGDLALSYVESALRDTASTVAALKARVAELEVENKTLRAQLEEMAEFERLAFEAHPDLHIEINALTKGQQ